MILFDFIQVLISKEYLQLEPIGLVFVFFFGLILIIQFVAMLFHRFGTLSHILASTELSCCSRKVTFDCFLHLSFSKFRIAFIMLNLSDRLMICLKTPSSTKTLLKSCVIYNGYVALMMQMTIMNQALTAIESAIAARFTISRNKNKRNALPVRWMWLSRSASSPWLPKVKLKVKTNRLSFFIFC